MPAVHNNEAEDTMKKELEAKKYNDYLIYVLNNDPSETLLCATPIHANELVTKLINMARNNIRIFLGNSPDTIPGYLHDEEFIKNCSLRNINLKVLLTNRKKATADVNYDHFISSCVHHRRSDLFELKVASKESLKELQSEITYKSGEIMTFFLFDENKYMLQLQPNTYSSTACFDSPDTTNRLATMFNKAFQVAVRY